MAARSAHLTKKLDALIAAARAIDSEPDEKAVAALLAAAEAAARDRGWPQLLASYGVKHTMPKQKRAAKSAPVEAKNMDQDSELNALIAWATSAALTEDNRDELRSKLASKRINKDAMQYLAKKIVGAAPRTKKDAQQAIERWFANRLNARIQGGRIYSSTASG